MDVEHARSMKRRKAVAMADLRSGALPLAEALREPPRALLNVPIWQLLCTRPGIGPENCREILQRCHIWPLHRLCDLKTTELEAVIELLH